MARSWLMVSADATIRPKIAANPEPRALSLRGFRRVAVFRFAVAALCAVAVPASAAPCPAAIAPGLVRVTVEATGVRSAAGEAAFTVYPDIRKRFLAKGGKLARVRTPAIAGTTSACFALTPGYYPIVIYHDANGDRDFNRTLFAPREGFGFGNDAPAVLALPSFDKVRVRVGPGATTVRIRMRYP